MERAKLLGTYGDVARLIDIVQQAVLAPFAKKGKPPKSVLPKERKAAGHMSDEYKAYLGEVLGIDRQGEGLEENAIRSHSSNSVD